MCVSCIPCVHWLVVSVTCLTAESPLTQTSLQVAKFHWHSIVAVSLFLCVPLKLSYFIGKREITDQGSRLQGDDCEECHWRCWKILTQFFSVASRNSAQCPLWSCFNTYSIKQLQRGHSRWDLSFVILGCCTVASRLPLFCLIRVSTWRPGCCRQCFCSYSFITPYQVTGFQFLFSFYSFSFWDDEQR